MTFSALTPAAARDFFAPEMRASMILVFHRACTMAMRKLEPVEEVWGQLGGAGKVGGSFGRLAIVRLSFAGTF